MKHVLNTLIFGSLIALTSCGADNAEKKVEKEIKIEEKTILMEKVNYNNSTTEIGYVAFKTTDKIGVGGKFTDFEITGTKAGKNALEVFENASFTIQTSSSVTGNEDRDAKILANVFGNFINSETISGNVVSMSEATDGKGVAVVNITMNDISNDVDCNYTVENDSISLNATIDIAKWNGLDAFAALNKVCFDLHKGADGESKLWSEVEIYIHTTMEAIQVEETTIDTVITE